MMDVKKVFEDYGWTPEQGDYHSTKNENIKKVSEKETADWYKKINYYYAALFLSLVIIGILIFK